MKKDIKLPILSKDEEGKLHGGFSIQPFKLETNFGASNGNCLGGGWFDTNTNCTGACSNCSVTTKPDIDK